MQSSRLTSDDCVVFITSAESSQNRLHISCSTTSPPTDERTGFDVINASSRAGSTCRPFFLYGFFLFGAGSFVVLVVAVTGALVVFAVVEVEVEVEAAAAETLLPEVDVLTATSSPVVLGPAFCFWRGFVAGFFFGVPVVFD